METIKTLFKDAMSQLSSGVSIVTSEVDGRPWGLTISACCSISLAPPLILISLATNTASTESINKQGKFGVNILSKEQINIAKAGAKPGAPKFFEDYVEVERSSGVYVVRDAMSQIACTVYDKVIAGDHIIFIGKVKNVVNNVNKEPLLYFNRNFGTFAMK